MSHRFREGASNQTLSSTHTGGAPSKPVAHSASLTLYTLLFWEPSYVVFSGLTWHSVGILSPQCMEWRTRYSVHFTPRGNEKWSESFSVLAFFWHSFVLFLVEPFEKSLSSRLFPHRTHTVDKSNGTVMKCGTRKLWTRCCEYLTWLAKNFQYDIQINLFLASISLSKNIFYNFEKIWKFEKF